MHHEFLDRSGLVNLPGEVMKIVGSLLLLGNCCPKGIPNWMTLVLANNVSSAQLPADKEEVILLTLYFLLLLNGRHIARPIIEAIPSQAPGLLGSRWTE